MEDNPLGNLPAKASRMWEDVFESAKGRGASESAAAAQAWCAVKRHYHKKGGRWLKRKTPIPPGKQPPGCTPVRTDNGACCNACAVGKACETQGIKKPDRHTRKLRSKLLR